MSYLCIVIPSPTGGVPQASFAGGGRKNSRQPAAANGDRKEDKEHTRKNPIAGLPEEWEPKAGKPAKHPLSTMLNYSIVMRSINSNLLNINQAKSRINAAKAALLKALGFTVGEAPDMKPFRPFFGHHAIPGGLLAGRKPQRG